jgi:tetratricopeptide (TPR) repeat protein
VVASNRANPEAAQAATGTAPVDDRLSYARILVELGDVSDAELEVAELLEEKPDDLDALSLLAKIKHMRGELSQAMACWAQMHNRSPLIETTQSQLRAILRLAMDPERGAGDFLALGPLQLARKPVAHLELEQAFAQFIARRPDQARALCATIATRYRKDREVYKLAVLGSAWIAELSGQLEESCRVLEGLGSERGFETDTDRVLALARVYERLGTPERLEAAAHICHYLEGRYRTLSLLGRLASLYRRLGALEEARAYDARYLEAFRRRKHRPTFLEITAVAAKRYIQLARLAAIHAPASELPSNAPLRQRAIAAALAGRLEDARATFEAGGEALDRKYLADLAVLVQDPEEATRRYLESLRDEPEDVAVISWLLEQEAQHGPTAVAEYFRDPGHFTAARRALDAALRVYPLRAGLWRNLATLLALLPANRDEPLRAAERAAALEQASLRDAKPIGRALAAAAFHFVGRAKGIVHEVWASREVAEEGRGGALPTNQILGNISPDMAVAIQNTFTSVREYARSKFPQLTNDLSNYNYSFKITKEDEPSSGSSAGLPTALAFLSVLLQRAIPQDVASSGAIVADAHDVLTVRAIGDVEHKVKAAYHRNLRMIILPVGNRAELMASSQVPAAVHDEIVRYVANLDEALRLLFGQDVFLAGLTPEP